MTREQLLADTARALRECFPDRAEPMIREIESRFDPPAIDADPEAGRVEVRMSGTGPYAWPEREGWGLAFEFTRALRRLADAGYKGDVQVVILARRS